MHTRTLKGFISLCCIFSILSNSIFPGLFASVPVLAEAPPPVSLAPAVRSSEVAITESLPTKAMPTPVPSDLFPEAEAARVRQAMETTLAKYRQYYGPRLSLMLDEVEITGEWAHAVVATGETKGATSLPATLHLLARRLPDGEWHALLPDGDNLYRQWAQAVPTKLISADEKTQMLNQAETFAAQRRLSATPVVPPPLTSTVPAAINPPALNRASPTPTPTPVLRWEDADAVTPTANASSYAVYLPVVVSNELVLNPERSVEWKVYRSEQFGYTIRYPSSYEVVDWQIKRVDVGGVPSDVWFGSQIHVISRIPPLPDDVLTRVFRSAENVSLGQGLSGLKLERTLVPVDGGEIVVSVEYFVQTKWADYFLIYEPSNSADSLEEQLSIFEQMVASFSLLPEHAYSAQEIAVSTASADGFDFFVNPPDGGSRSPSYASYNARNPYLTNTAPCYNKPYSELQHAGEDWFRSAGTSVYAVANGRVIYAQNANYPGAVVIIEHTLANNWTTPWGGNIIYSVYGHLSTSGLIAQWSDVSKGDRIGSVLDQGSNSHVHFEMRHYGDMNNILICPANGKHSWPGPGYTDTGVHPDNYGYTNPSSWIDSHRSGGTSTPCSSPSLSEPPDGVTLNNRTVTFRWNAVSGCIFNGYTFRVCTSSNVDNLSNCFIDTGVGSTQRTETISGRDNQDLWWGVKAANAPNGASWAVRRFRISPDSGPPSPDHSVQFYKDASYGGDGYCGGDSEGNYNSLDSCPGYNDQISSVLLKSGWSVRVFKHANLGEPSKCFTSSDSNFANDTFDDGSRLNDEMSSFALYHQSSCPPLVTPPPAPALQSPANSASFNEGENITLAWSATGSEYYGEVWGGPAGTTSFGWQTGTSKNIGSQWAGYTYSWHIKARNSAGESGWSSTRTFTVKPAAPSNLNAQTASCTQVNLMWSDNSGNEEGYKIYRDGVYLTLVGANVTNYQDTDLSGDTFYSYYVRAYRGSIESDAGNTVNITTPFCAPLLPDLRPYTPPGYPYPVVPSSALGTHVVDNLYAGQVTCFDWFFINSGNETAWGDFHVELWVDDTRYIRYPFSDWGSGGVSGFDDWLETISAPGWHTVRLITDPDNTIAESDETNNVWERQFYWISSAPYTDLMEGGINGWTATGLWHQMGADTSLYPETHSWSHSWFYGQDDVGDYSTGVANSGDLTSPLIYVPTSDYYLRFWYWYQTETSALDWDQRWLQISVDEGPFENVLQFYDDPMNLWLQSQAINLSGYVGHTIQVRFHFDTLDDINNGYRGWYIDDFSITTTPPPTCSDIYEPNDTPAQATSLAYGQSRSADICAGGDYDFYEFTGAAGDRVVVDIDAKVDGSALDSYIFLLDSDGASVLAANDDEVTAVVRDAHLGYHLPADGTYYIKVRAWDHPSAGGSDYFYTIRLLTDFVDPASAVITTPISDTWLDPTQQTITVSAVDNESGINRVEFLWHDADWENSDWIWLGSDIYSLDGWNWTFDTSGLADQQGGAFYIWAFDWVGNWIGAASWGLGLDRTPPSVSLDTTLLYGDAPFLDFYLHWSGTDNLSGVDSYDIQYRDGAAGVWTDLLTDTTDVYTRFVGQNGHTYYFRGRARDRVGNQGVYTEGDGDTWHTVEICAIAADANEADNSYAKAGTISTDGTWKTHNFHAAADVDWLKFTATAGVTYTLRTNNTGGHADTMLSLYAPDGTTLLDANDDDPDNWPASRIEWGALKAGVYYIEVQHWDPHAYGCTTVYEVSVTQTGHFDVERKVFLPLVLKKREGG